MCHHAHVEDRRASFIHSLWILGIIPRPQSIHGQCFLPTGSSHWLLFAGLGLPILPAQPPAGLGCHVQTEQSQENMSPGKQRHGVCKTTPGGPRIAHPFNVSSRPLENDTSSEKRKRRVQSGRHPSSAYCWPCLLDRE